MRRIMSTKYVIYYLLYIIIVLFGMLTMQSEVLQRIFGVVTLQGIGGSLVATGLAGMIISFYVITTDEMREQIAIISQAGLVNIFSQRAASIKPQYDQRINTARNIDIIGFGLSALREDYLNSFESWSNNSLVRILITDPDYPGPGWRISDQRDREERNAHGQIAQDVRKFLEEVQELESLNREQFQIRLMQVLPAVNVFRTDDELFFGPYLIRQQSRNTPTFLAKKGGFLYSSVLQHFNEIWSSDELSQPFKYR